MRLAAERAVVLVWGMIEVLIEDRYPPARSAPLEKWVQTHAQYVDLLFLNTKSALRAVDGD